MKYTRWQDAHASLFGKLLLQAGLRASGLTHLSLTDLQYTVYHRPYFAGGIDFNISHSGAFVVCVLSNECRVGVDIEEIKPVALDDFRQQWTIREWEEIMNAPNRCAQFYHYWTKKEALLKASGKGLSVPMQQVEVYEQHGLLHGEWWHLKKLPIAENYVTHLATDKATAGRIMIEEVRFP